MGLWVLQNASTVRVVSDLIKIVHSDPGFSVNTNTGQVTYIPTLSSVGGSLVIALVSSPCAIGIRGESANWSFDPAAGNTLVDAGGVTVYDQYPGTTVVEVVYDVSDCNGSGQWIEDGNHNRWKWTTDVNLFHELAHAFHMCAGTYNAGDPETQAISEENKYRAALRLPLRVGHVGGCGAYPLAPPSNTNTGTTGTTGNDCFIATAAYGSPMEPEVEFLRRFRDDILRKTRSGKQFFDNFYEYYYRVSPMIVELMQQDAQLKNAVRCFLVEPIVQYLQIALRFPDTSLESVEEPWRSFLVDLRSNLERWAKAIDAPHDFDGLSPQAAAEEIAIVMRYMLRTHSERVTYLERLQELKQIPLQNSAEANQKITERLQSMGRTHAEIAQILGQDDEARPTEAKQLKIVKGRGTDHVRQRDARFPANDWIYTVTLTNYTQSDTVDQVVLFYKRVGLPGVVFLEALSFTPGPSGRIVFVLGSCSQMESYAVGFYMFDDQGNPVEVAKIPSQGNMTPALASQLNPTDTDPCADSWGLYP